MEGQTLDFSKGYFDYKKRMCTLEYNFEYHIIYDTNSIVSKSIGAAYYAFFELKAYMRKKGLDVKFHKFTYFIKNKKQANTQNLNAKTINLNNLSDFKDLVKISNSSLLHPFFIT